MDQTHRLGAAEAGDGDVSMVVESEVEEVEGCAKPEVETGEPHQHCVLEALGQVGVMSEPGQVPVLKNKDTLKALAASH